MVKTNLEKANCIHFTTDNESAKINDWLGLKLKSKIIPYGLKTSIPKLATESFRKNFNIASDKKIILFIGRINWIKGLDILFKAFESLLKTRKDLLMICAGPDSENYFKKLNQLVSPEAQKSIIKTGMLDNTEKLNAYEIADLFVLPSYSENFGMTVIEAARQELPIIISNQVGVFNEFKNNKAAIIINCDKNQLFSAMNELLQNEQKAEKLKRNAYNLFKKCFNQKVTVGKFQEMYKECPKN
jgi:glycosyltransferase involved in cell wall biosynthesis